MKERIEMEITVYNPHKGRHETINVEFTPKNTTWLYNDKTPRHIRMLTDYKGGILIAEFDYTYPFRIYGVSRSDINHDPKKARRLRNQYE